MTGSVKLSTISKQFYMSAGQIRQKDAYIRTGSAWSGMERSVQMAFCTVLSASVQGLGVEMIRVEADVSNGLPMFHMVGYLSSEVKEASERVRTAIRNSGMKLPAKKIIVNLAPATVRKKGASFDLPIALAVLAAMGIYRKKQWNG